MVKIQVWCHIQTRQGRRRRRQVKTSFSLRYFSFAYKQKVTNNPSEKLTIPFMFAIKASRDYKACSFEPYNRETRQTRRSFVSFTADFQLRTLLIATFLLPCRLTKTPPLPKHTPKPALLSFVVCYGFGGFWEGLVHPPPVGIQCMSDIIIYVMSKIWARGWQRENTITD